MNQPEHSADKILSQIKEKAKEFDPDSGSEDLSAANAEFAQLMELHDRELVIAAYRQVLLREPDPSYVTYLEQLRCGTLSKLELLCQLRYSAEGQSAGVPLVGLPSSWAFSLSKISKIPLIGRLLIMINFAWKLPEILQSLRRLEAKIFRSQRDLLLLREQVNLKENPRSEDKDPL